MIVVYNRRSSIEKIQLQHPHTAIFDMTSRSSPPWIRFSPFYPHGGIPVPFSPGYLGASVEGIWQGLKVFEKTDIDTRKFTITTMKTLKRSVRVYGKVLGHRQGVGGERLLSYLDARYEIYLPLYAWVLEHYLQDQLAELKRIGKEKTLVFLDYETNCDIDVTTRPLSHAGLIKLYLEDNWPHRETSSLFF